MTSEIVSRIWEGRIPVRIGLSARDSQQGLAPSVFYCGTLRRNGYIHVVLPLLLRFFAPFVEDSSALKRDDWWLEFEDVPVKWNWPIGVSFDVMTGFDPSNAEPEPQAWELTLHHKDYPAEYIVPILTPPPSVRNQFLEDYWINQMKEACFILTGSAKPIMNLSRANSANFWKSVENRKFPRDH
ncbi:unnamed protein product [Kuraishia capsulata CBS 1993]|uniref:Uncharacterized protein n=1 Tax=Kuraishia capsulata CBS 1993 TaxID=1382522 RepID=W6MGP2_9ASCO|nr:uncharacterized protein KUCA_T00000704001 [Kuraishia capsulata CBS 1993]CDK24738.1 unnamed protein product [Kuraishia capsulata CBS 1993]